jgi:polyisoprenoid-binding protein YceI
MTLFHPTIYLNRAGHGRCVCIALLVSVDWEDGIVARYTILPARSRVWIGARSSVHPIHSSTAGLEGFIDFDADRAGRVGSHPAGKLSFPVSRLSSGNPLERRELQKRIGARRYPTIDGMLTSMEPLDEGRLRVRGDLAFRGVTRSVEGNMAMSVVDDRTIRLEGESTFDVRDFGMEPPRILMLRVEPDVYVRVEVIAEREG